MTKATQFVRLIAVVSLLALPSVGCKRTPVNVTHLPASGTGGNPVDAGTGQPLAPTDNKIDTTGGGIVSNPAGSHSGWIEHPEILKSDTVHFDYDSSAVKSSEKSRVTAVADYLKGHS